MYKVVNTENVKGVIERLINKEVEIERVLEGVSTFVYRVKVKDNGVVYFRILPDMDKTFAAEVIIHEMLIDFKLKVPEIIYYKDKNEELGLSIMMIERIKGTSIEKELPDNYKEVLSEAGYELAILNSIMIPGYGFIDFQNEELSGVYETFETFVKANLRSDLSKLSSYGVTELEKQLIEKYINQLSKQTRVSGNLNHGDFDISHIFHNNDKYSGLIDFGEITSSSELYDLGHFKLHDTQTYKKELFYYLLDGYNKYNELSEEEYYEINLWAIFIGVRRLGMIYGRSAQEYSDFLVRRVKKIIHQLSGENAYYLKH